MKVSKTKTALLKLADSLSEEARKTHKAIVAEKKVIEDRFDGLRDTIRADLDALEAAEEANWIRQEQAIARMLELSEPATIQRGTTGELTERLEDLRKYERFEWDFAFKSRASDVYAAATDRLNAAYAAAAKREAETAELIRLREEAAERQRQADEDARRHREAELARKAAEAARVAAEQEAERKLQAERDAAAKRERDAQEATARAEAARLRAEEHAAAAAVKAERERAAAAIEAERQKIAAVEAEKRRIMAEAEKARIEAETARKAAEAEAAKRAANTAHRQKINREILAVLTDANGLALTEAQGKAVITAVARGEVPNMSIKY
jgi:hypothetical protein